MKLDDAWNVVVRVCGWFSLSEGINQAKALQSFQRALTLCRFLRVRFW